MTNPDEYRYRVDMSQRMMKMRNPFIVTLIPVIRNTVDPMKA
jgi:hypothetical protein